MLKLFDKNFKAGLLILGALFLWIYYCSAQNGRYQVQRYDTDIHIFDTRRGIYYKTTSSGSVDVIDPIGGSVKFKKLPFMIKERKFIAE